MKVGILTLMASDNCGSLLQAYALQRAVEKREYDVEIVDFRPYASEEVYQVFPSRPWKHIHRTLNAILHGKMLKRQREAYEDFRQKWFKLSEISCRSSEELEAAGLNYNAVICGSDQIWNVNMQDFDEAYFLNWTGAKKVAYGASLGGTNFWEYGYREKISDWLKGYEAISVREKSTIPWIEEVAYDNQVELVVDPTLLIDTEDWEPLIGERKIKEDYIFYYSWSYNNRKLNSIVQQFAKDNNLPVYVINLSRWVMMKPREFGFLLFDDMGPVAFLNLMKYAKYTFAESLHGILFSYIFQKKFWILDANPVNKLDARIDYFTDLLQVQHLIVREYDDIELADANWKDVYGKYNVELEKLKRNSNDFLDKALNNGK